MITGISRSCWWLIFVAVISTASILCGSNLFAASDYPSRPITLIVPMPPGGVTDLSARALTESLEKSLGKPVTVLNKPGGGYTIGGNAVATAKPDGYTLGLLNVAAAQPEVFTYFYKAPYANKDLKAVCRVFGPVLTISVKYDAPWNSVKDLVEYARKNPGLKVATHGRSGLSYVVLKSIAKKENVTFSDVPYEGGSPMVPALLGGHVPVGCPAYPDASSLIEAKKLKVLAVLMEKRVAWAPDVPSIPDLGYKLAYESYLGIFGPKGLPDEIVATLNRAVQKIAADPAFQKKIYATYTQVNYEPTSVYERSIAQYRDNLTAFFKEEGMVSK